MKNCNWFTVKQVAQGIWGIGEFKHSEEVISYLIVGSKQALLWDTGLGLHNIDHIVKQITKHPTMVMNSHSHYDHIGGNGLFSNIIPHTITMVKLNPFQFNVINTPGHSPDSICLYERKYGYLFTGDTLYNGPIYLHLPESNLEDYKKSIKSLLLLPKVERIFPSHNSFKFSKTKLIKINNSLKSINKKNERKIIITQQLSLLI